MYQTVNQKRFTTAAIVKSPSSLGSAKNVSRSFGLKSSSSFRIIAMAAYKVKLIGPEGQENEFEA
ncbi:ferredoxin, partial [Trifolium medium]|nr:ferredoxin [Trifolium medium]